MDFTRLNPHPNLADFIECYWMMYSDATEPVVEKIIPDGFPEIIFNYRDVYQAKTTGDWSLQKPNLLAGQLRTFFYLQNTGRTGSVAIKLKPAALTQLFDFQMNDYLDKIVDLDSFCNPIFDNLKEQINRIESNGFQKDAREVQQVLDSHFLKIIPLASENPLREALELTFSKNGRITVAEMATASDMGERQMERLFKKYIGLSPKYYARIIRFNYIFQLIRSDKCSWAEVVYQSGYYDQSHFIRNFKAFTGEDPSSYFFDEKNMANFFLNK